MTELGATRESSSGAGFGRVACDGILTDFLFARKKKEMSALEEADDSDQGRQGFHPTVPPVTSHSRSAIKLRTPSPSSAWPLSDPETQWQLSFPVRRV